MATTRKQPTSPLSLQGLAQASGTDPGLTDEASMRSRANTRKDTMENAVDATNNSVLYGGGESMANGAAQNSYFNDFNRRDVGNLDHQWAPFFEAMQEAPERLTGKPGAVQIGGLDAMPTDQHLGTLPVALQGLQGVDYDRDAFGFPIAAHMRRGVR